jgi:hypothetical protein
MKLPLPQQPETAPADLDLHRARRAIEQRLGLPRDQYGIPGLLIQAALANWQIGGYLQTRTLSNRAEIVSDFIMVSQFLTSSQAHERLENFIARARLSQIDPDESASNLDANMRPVHQADPKKRAGGPD